MKTIFEHLNEASGLDVNLKSVMLAIEYTGEVDLKKFYKSVGMSYIDTPGTYAKEHSDYYGITDFLQQNMGGKAYVAFEKELDSRIEDPKYRQHFVDLVSKFDKNAQFQKLLRTM